MSWEPIVAKAQAAVHSAIPEKWRLPKTENLQGKCVLSIPRTCGVLTADQLDITEQTATELLAKLARGKLRSVDVVDAFCARAAIAHQLVNCLAAFFPEEASKRAKELDEHLQKTGQPVGPLHGLPIALKDTFGLIGRATTYGFAAKADHKATHNSAIVNILWEAGAVFYVKTTMPQTGMALETESRLFGRTLNPFNTDLVAGGSSGGDSVLVALHGSPLAPSTDIGGSIRAPAAFNGLYGIRPTADRIPKERMWSVENGQTNIRVSCGPVCHSMADVKMFTEVINSYPAAKRDIFSIPVPWKDVKKPTGKLAFGLLKFDGVVMPHPPLLRAMEETAAELKAEGHEVIEFSVPFDCWECSQVAFKLYYQTGVEDTKALLDSVGEPMLPAIKLMLDIYDPKPLTAAEVLSCVRQLNEYKVKFRDAWEQTIKTTKTGRPIDALICPNSASAGYPHGFLPWWGYFTLFNAIDYPSMVLPLKGFKIDAHVDVKDTNYEPLQSNPFDASNHAMYDPVFFQNQPVTLQIVGRPFEDEQLIAVTEALDDILNIQYLIHQ